MRRRGAAPLPKLARQRRRAGKLGQFFLRFSGRIYPKDKWIYAKDIWIYPLDNLAIGKG